MANKPINTEEKMNIVSIIPAVLVLFLIFSLCIGFLFKKEIHEFIKNKKEISNNDGKIEENNPDSIPTLEVQTLPKKKGSEF